MLNKEELSPEQVNILLISMTKSFFDFSEKIAKGVIKELAAPFSDYQNWEGDILSYYNDFFDRYNSQLSKLNKSDIQSAEQMVSALVKDASGITVSFDLLNEVRAVENMIHDSMVMRFKGFPSEAFNIFEKGMLASDLHLMNLLPQIIINNASYFRVRKKGQGRITESKDLFHVPFEKRGKNATYRYSVPGYPSLYLSHRLEIACLETGIKRWDSYYASSFKAEGDRSLRFIDLSLTNAFYTVWERYSLLVFYPLIMACGLKVKHPGDAFKPEYVIPQLLAQVVRLHMVDGRFDGISYICTKVEYPDFRDVSQRNYVLWITGAEQESGYSKSLSDKVLATKPLKCYPCSCFTKNEHRLLAEPYTRILDNHQ